MTAEWREETINGDTTPQTQAGHTAVEASELHDLFLKLETYDQRGVEDLTEEELEEVRREAGDVIVAHLGTLSMAGLDVVECVEAAMEKNGSRDWAGWQEGRA